MAHGNNLIHSIKLPNGTTYEIHDAQAIHNLSDIEALGLAGAFIYKGTVAKVSDLPATGNEVGYVYHVTENESEYVWTVQNDQGKWEEFGHHMTLEHTHNVTVTGTNESSSVAGTATVTGVNKASNVTASGSISVPKVTKSANYVKLTKSNDLFLQSYPGSTKKLALGSVRGVSGEVDVIDSVNAPTTTVTGVSGSTTASKATAGTAIAVAKVGTATTVATGLTGGSVSAGSPASWNANVEDGVLSFSFTANNPTAVTLPTATTAQITPAASAGNITPYTFTDITVPVAASAATTVVTGVTTDTATVATANASATTVATGSLGDTGTGASVLVGLGTPTSARALINVELDEGTSSDILVGDTVAITTEDKTVDVTGTAAAQVWSQGSGAVVGTAAGQKWTQTSGTTGNPVSE